MTFVYKDFIKGIIIGTVFIALYLFFSELLKFFIDIRTIEVIAAIAGGFSAGLFSYIYEKKRRTEEKRSEKYHEHRNALVQIEHELIEARVVLARNISSLENALQVRDRYRLILRFFPISLSRGLDLKILNLDLINKYSQLLSSIDLINSDFEYTSGLVLQIRDVLQSPELRIKDSFTQALMQSLVDGYVQLITVTLKLCLSADEDIADLIARCKIAIDNNSEPLIKQYVRDPKLIDYKFPKREIERIKETMRQQETRPGTEKISRSQFVAPYMDVMKVVNPTSTPQSI